MKYKRICLGLFILIIGSGFINLHFWESVHGKTWVSHSEGSTGEQLVFYTSANGVKRAIRQTYGSGVYVTATYQYDVELNQDTIKLLPVTPSEDERRNTNLVYVKEDMLLLDIRSGLTYKVHFNEAFIYNWQGNYHKGEKLPLAELIRIPIVKGNKYPENSFKK